MSDTDRLWRYMEKAVKDDAAWQWAGFIMDLIPEGWAKVDGEWHLISGDHFVSFQFNGYDVDWHIEHSLSCRLRGFKDCVEQREWVAYLEAHHGAEREAGRYRIWVETDGDYGTIPCLEFESA